MAMIVLKAALLRSCAYTSVSTYKQSACISPVIDAFQLPSPPQSSLRTIFLVQRLDVLDNADRSSFGPQLCGSVEKLAAAAVTVTQLTSINRDLIAKVCLKSLRRLSRLFHRHRILTLEGG